MKLNRMNPFIAMGLLTLSGAALVGLAAHNRERKPSATLYTAIEMRGDGSVWTELDKNPNRFQLRFAAAVRRDIYARPDGSRQVVYSFGRTDYRLGVNGAENTPVAAQVTAALRRTARAEIAANGAVTALFAPADTPAAARGVLRTLVFSLQSARPDGGEASEKSAGGSVTERTEPETDLLQGASVRVRYRLRGSRVERQRLQFSPPRPKWGIIPAAARCVAVYRDSGTVTVGASGEAAQGEIALDSQLRRGGSPVSALHMTLTAREEASFPASTDAPSNATEEDILTATDYAGAERKMHQNTLGQDTFETLARQTEAARDGGDLIGLDRKWRSLFVLQPERRALVREFALKQSGRSLGTLTNALMQVGTADAQTILQEICEKKRGVADGDEALNYLAGGERPTAETIAYLRQRAALDSDDGYPAAVALGVLACQWSDDDPTAARRLVVQLEEQATDTRRSVTGREAAYVGLGNSACPDALPVLLTGTRHADKALAMTALQALQNIDGPLTLRALKTLAQSNRPDQQAIARRILLSRKQTGN